MNTSKLKTALSYLPEAVLSIVIVISFSAEFLETSSVNYSLIAGAVILAILIVWKNKYYALILSFILGLISLYMLLAVISEYQEFPLNSADGLALLAVGSTMFLSLLVISFFLPGKYMRSQKT